MLPFREQELLEWCKKVDGPWIGGPPSGPLLQSVAVKGKSLSDRVLRNKDFKEPQGHTSSKKSIHGLNSWVLCLHPLGLFS